MLQRSLVFAESISAREFTPAPALVGNPHMSFLNVPRKTLLVELLITRFPSAENASIVRPMNSMNLAQVSGKIVAINQGVTMQSIYSIPPTEESLSERMGLRYWRRGRYSIARAIDKLH